MTDPTTIPLLLWDAEQVGKALVLTADGVKFLHRTGQLPGIIVSRHLRFRPSDVEQFVAKLTSGGEA